VGNKVFVFTCFNAYICNITKRENERPQAIATKAIFKEDECKNLLKKIRDRTRGITITQKAVTYLL
jgi:hypothetical protein